MSTLDAFTQAEADGARVQRIGEGQSRIAFVCADIPGVVFKRLRSPGMPDNAREFDFWNAACDDVREHLAPLLEYDAERGLLAMARTETSTARNAHREWSHLLSPAWSSDVHEHNVGLYKGRWVLHDYGHCRIDELPRKRDGFERTSPPRKRDGARRLGACFCGDPACNLGAMQIMLCAGLSAAALVLASPSTLWAS